VTMYLSPKLQETVVHYTSMMRPGSRVVTHDYPLSDAIPTARWSMQAPFFGNANQPTAKAPALRANKRRRPRPLRPCTRESPWFPMSVPQVLDGSPRSDPALAIGRPVGM
jgi:hypothetical protein